MEHFIWFNLWLVCPHSAEIKFSHNLPMITILIKLGSHVTLFKLALYSIGTITTHCLPLVNICFVKLTIENLNTWSIEIYNIFKYSTQESYESTYKETNLEKWSWRKVVLIVMSPRSTVVCSQEPQKTTSTLDIGLLYHLSFQERASRTNSHRI